MVQGPKPKGTNPKGTKENFLSISISLNEEGLAFSRAQHVICSCPIVRGCWFTFGGILGRDLTYSRGPGTTSPDEGLGFRVP